MSKHIPALDGIRGIAILLVLFWHYFTGKFLTYPFLLKIPVLKWMFHSTLLTWSGVDLFFVLSGFLVGGIVIDHRLDGKLFSTFYIRRICRIFPIYFAWIGLFCLGTLFLTGKLFTTIFNYNIPLWSYLTYSQNWMMVKQNEFGASWLEVTWSLAIEEQFYIFLPLMIFFIPLKRLKWVCIFLVISAPILRTLLFNVNNHSGLAGYVLTPCRWDALFLGVLLALLVRNRQFLNWNSKNPVLLQSIFILLGLFLLIFGSSFPWDFFMQSFGFTLLSIFYGSLILLSIFKKKGLLHSFLCSGFLAYFGKISYGLYLTHAGILYLVRYTFPFHTTVGAALIITALMSLTLTIGISHLSFKYFETPIIRWGRRFNYKTKTP